MLSELDHLRQENKDLYVTLCKLKIKTIEYKNQQENRRMRLKSKSGKTTFQVIEETFGDYECHM